MGQSDELPDENVYANFDVSSKVEAGRFASVVENYFYTARSVTRAVRDFVPRADDVILASNPRTGDFAVLRILRLINARDDEEFEQVLKEKQNDKVPWIESKFVDGDPEILNADQPGSRRLFKSHMAHQGLSIKRKNAPRFVSMARHPIDFRLSWYKYIKDVYAVGGNDLTKSFESMYSPDDFVDVQATTAQIMPLAKILTYEHIMLDWYLESKKNPRVHVVFYEMLVVRPEQVVEELAEFMEVKLPGSRVDAICRVIKSEGLVPSSPSFMGNDEEDEDMGTARTNRGMSTFAGYEDQEPTKRSTRAETVALGNGLEFSWESCDKMRKKWKRALDSTQAPADLGDDYESFFLKATGMAYPFPKRYPPKPLKQGPLDKIGRRINEEAKKCSVM